MKVRELINSKPVWVAPREPISDVALIMRESNCSFVAIVDEDHAVGVVTDRDIAMALALEGNDATLTPVAEVMSSPPYSIGVDASLEEVAEEMISRDVRRLVVNEQGLFIGVVSVAELAGLISDERIVRALHSLALQSHPLAVQHPGHTIPGYYLG